MAVHRLFRGPGLGALFRGLLGGTLLGTRDLALLLAGIALAPDRLEEFLEVFRAVIVVDLFAGLDVLDGADEHLAVARLHVGLGVGPAGVVDIARDVAADRTVDGPAAVQFEQVLVLDLVMLFVPRIQQRPEILDDFVAFLDRLGGEQAEPGAGTADAVGLAA